MPSNYLYQRHISIGYESKEVSWLTNQLWPFIPCGTFLIGVYYPGDTIDHIVDCFIYVMHCRIVMEIYPLQFNILCVFHFVTHLFKMLIKIKCPCFTVILLSLNNSRQVLILYDLKTFSYRRRFYCCENSISALCCDCTLTSVGIMSLLYLFRWYVWCSEI